MNRLMGVSAAALMALSGCSSIEQVPLVYVSTSKVGVSVETGSPEAPGASLMIGVDLTDAAFVPVAVVQRCEGDTVELIQACANEIQKILGAHGFSSSEQNSQLSEIKQELESSTQGYQNAVKAYQEAVAKRERLADTVTELETASALIASFDESQSRASVELDDELERHEEQLRPWVSAIVPESEEVTAARSLVQGANLDQARTERDQAVRELGAAETALNENKAAFDRVVGRVQGLVIDSETSGATRDDALSVFGSFDGEIGASANTTDGATVSLGKSFSTGVAAQQLSQGIGNAKEVESKAQCLFALNEVLKAATAEQRASFELEDMTQLCRPTRQTER